MRDRRGDLTSTRPPIYTPALEEMKNYLRKLVTIDAVLKDPEVLKSCLEHAALGFCVTDCTGRLLEVNQAYCSITGYSEAELCAHSDPATLTFVEDLPGALEELRALISGEIPSVLTERRYVRKSGEIVWVHSSASLLRDEDGRPHGIIRLTQDITERKLTEASLQESLKRNEIILASVSDIHILLDQQWRYIYVNDAAVEAMERPRSEILGRTLWDTYPDIIGTELERQYRRAMDYRIPVAFEYHYATRDTWWANRFQPTREGLAVFATNITYCKRAEESLRRSERELADVQQLAALGSWSWDINTGLMTWSDELYRIFGLHPQEIQASFAASIERVHPDDRQTVLSAIDRCLKTHERYSQPNRIITADGKIRRIQLLGSVVTDEHGTPVRMFGLCRDMTELEESKEAQRAAELKYRSIFENAGEGIFQSTPEGCYLMANPALARMHGFSSPEDLIRSCHDISRHIYVDPARREEFKRTLETYGLVRGFEHQSFRKDGSKIWISVNARAVRNESGAISYYEGTTQDITERKQAEQALREGEERYRELFENSKDALYVHDMNGIYTSVNRAAEKLSGYTRDELIGKHFAGFLNPEYEKFVRDQLSRKFADSGETTYEAEIITKMGRLIPVEISSRFIFVNRVPVGVQGCVRDISERKRAQAAARTYSRRLIEAQEAERRRMSRELHDQVGQILTAVKMNLYALQQTCGAPEMLWAIKDNMEVIDEAIDQVRDLSVDLRPLLLDDFGLAVALRWYVDRQAKRCGIASRFTTHSLGEDDRFSSELETTCFRIVQEAVTNVVRHARANRVSVTLERSGSELVLTIADDGVGFDLNVLRNGVATLGLRGMEERVQSVGGSLTIDSAPTVGTEICARFPVAAATERSLAAALCDVSASSALR